MWVQKNVGSKKILGQEKFFDREKMWVKIILSQNKFASNKILVPPKFWVQKYFESEKNLGSKNILGPQKSWVKKKLGRKQFGTKKNFGPKTTNLTCLN